MPEILSLLWHWEVVEGWYVLRDLCVFSIPLNGRVSFTKRIVDMWIMRWTPGHNRGCMAIVGVDPIKEKTWKQPCSSLPEACYIPLDVELYYADPLVLYFRTFCHMGWSGSTLLTQVSQIDGQKLTDSRSKEQFKWLLGVWANDTHLLCSMTCFF